MSAHKILQGIKNQFETNQQNFLDAKSTRLVPADHVLHQEKNYLRLRLLEEPLRTKRRLAVTVSVMSQPSIVES